jgi:hypothetical protein
MRAVHGGFTGTGPTANPGTNSPVLRSTAFVSGPWRYERIDDAGQWLQVDAPERVNELLLDLPHLTASPVQAGRKMTSERS